VLESFAFLFAREVSACIVCVDYCRSTAIAVTFFVLITIIFGGCFLGVSTLSMDIHPTVTVIDFCTGVGALLFMLRVVFLAVSQLSHECLCYTVVVLVAAVGAVAVEGNVVEPNDVKVPAIIVKPQHQKMLQEVIDIFLVICSVSRGFVKPVFCSLANRALFLVGTIIRCLAAAFAHADSTSQKILASVEHLGQVLEAQPLTREFGIQGLELSSRAMKQRLICCRTKFSRWN
jgi:hypothetical protein